MKEQKKADKTEAAKKAKKTTKTKKKKTNLVIVESPSKAKTIKKYLGANYVVEATKGHVRDLPKSKIGVDTENNYEPQYITIRGKGEVLTVLRKEAKKAEKVYLATDPDREGEAIAWHLAHALKLDETDKVRIEFNEVTKGAVKDSIKNPREINKDLVDAQQARRVLDRLIGYNITPILWRKVKSGLSAGRVQSVALKIVCDREKEIQAFDPTEYWTVEGALYKDKKRQSIDVKVHSFEGKKIEKLELQNEKSATKIKEALEKGKYIVEEIKETKKQRGPSAPFTTSTLQQEANKKMNYTTKKTMSVAQRLYEGITVRGFGTVGLITYMRTDSVRISNDAQQAARSFIEQNIGKEYLPEKPPFYKTKKGGAQEAHEAIRPTNVEITPEIAKANLATDEYKIYKLIWDRFVASQMTKSIYATTTITIENSGYSLRASSSKVLFDGYSRVYQNASEAKVLAMPDIEKGDELQAKSMEGLQHFTQPPARYSEATLVSMLEEQGIGRPSTYAPTITTLLARRYVVKEKKMLAPTELGEIINDIMCEHFKKVVDLGFTEEMEKNLDKIELGEKEWKSVVDKFYSPIQELIEIAEKELAKITIEDVVSDVPCEKCGAMMVIKQSRLGGEFLACPNFPECDNTKPIVKEIGVDCPKCGGPIQEKKSKKGNIFYGCGNYPECDYVRWKEPVNKKCPVCEELMVKGYDKKNDETFIMCDNKECENFKKKEKLPNEDE